MPTTESAYQNHKNADIGETAVFTTEDGDEYRGTIQDVEGATVYVIGDDSRMYEIRRINDGGDHHVVLGIDGKSAAEKVDEETDGAATRESYRLSFDAIVEEFESEQEQRTIG